LNTQNPPEIAKTARTYNVPYQRLLARYHGRQSKHERPGAGRKLNNTQDLAVCQYLEHLDRMGTSARYGMLAHCANTILKLSHNDPTTLPPTVGPLWPKRFLQAHPQFHIRKQQSLDIARKNAHDPENIRVWFRGYQQLCMDFGIQEGDIYNFDETGFRIGVGKFQWIITRDLSRKSYHASDNNRKFVTVVECVSGDGNVLPPMFILAGSVIQSAWFNNSLDNDVVITVSETEYSYEDICLAWVKHFEKHSAKRRQGVCRLLLCDGYGSHTTKDFIDFCVLHQIKIYCLPPHTSHILQPLDVVLSQPYMHYHIEAIDAATRSGCDDFNMLEFLDTITSIRQKTFKKTSIQSSFRKTDLIPYNPEYVLNNLREQYEQQSPPPVLLKVNVTVTYTAVNGLVH